MAKKEIYNFTLLLLQVIHVNWVEQYKRIREMLDIKWPGYMIHESGMWSNVHKKWFFLPRRCSKETYDEVTDERMGCSVLISADADVYNLKVVKVSRRIKCYIIRQDTRIIR